MPRLAIAYMTICQDQEERWATSSWWEDDPLTKLKWGRLEKTHTGGLSKCSQCGTDVKIHVSPKRNPRSGKLGRTVSLKDHDLCRSCWRQIIRTSRESLDGAGYYLSDERREVA